MKASLDTSCTLENLWCSHRNLMFFLSLNHSLESNLYLYTCSLQGSNSFATFCKNPCAHSSLVLSNRLLLRFLCALGLKSHRIYGPYLSSFLPGQPAVSDFTASASSLGGDGLSGCNQNEKCS